jgi:hypothetical protein
MKFIKFFKFVRFVKLMGFAVLYPSYPWQNKQKGKAAPLTA